MKNSRWTDNIFLSTLHNHLLSYPTPKNLSYSWSFGALSGICLIIQLISGLFLSMHYIPDVNVAFASVEHIMRDVNYGWFARYLHSNGASMFFFTIFFHIFRNIYFGSYLHKRIALWNSGILIFFLLMAIAFMGYVLPWGQMSFWGATVITNLFSAIPIYGTTIVEWLWGGFSVEQATLNRFYSFHFFFPFVLAALVFIHLTLLHEVGSNDPANLDSNTKYKQPVVINFFPYFFTKDLHATLIFFLILFYFVFFYPNILGHPDNYIEANPMITPAHIVPEWYFLPFYAILRSIPDKLGGVIAMALSILSLMIFPYYKSIFSSVSFRFIYRFWVFIFAGNFILLGWIGQQPVEEPFTQIGMYCTALYFIIIFFIFPYFVTVVRIIFYISLNLSYFFLAIAYALRKYRKF